MNGRQSTLNNAIQNEVDNSKVEVINYLPTSLQANYGTSHCYFHGLFYKNFSNAIRALYTKSQYRERRLEL